ncbi:uncharacterized protein LOC132294725 [Cornus florida]|uniref:uncharacterized protein LOC132294725 n=1 Tax=Cornus florida TaxID=4283 RepID=UPI0028969591|nr:uncharacterized protein LOC132294725 [Cornus florida]
MYVTRPLSLYLNFPDSLSLPPEGPNSGYLVLQDEESETTCCFGFCNDPNLQGLPFPQNKDLAIHYSTGGGEYRSDHYDDVSFIPVLNQPLSSNRYYAIKPHGKHKGEAYACSTEEDKATCCFCRCVQDVKPRPLNPDDMYQQFEFFLYPTFCKAGSSFYAKSVAPDGHPPDFLRRKGWDVKTKNPRNYELGEAPGLNAALRARLPEFNFPLACKNSEVVIIGKWYCPFMFIKEGTLKEQMKASMFYEMTLEQTWEKIFACENNYNEGNSVSVGVVVQKEVAFVAQREAVWDEKKVVDGAIWFTGFGGVGEDLRVGLSLAIVERMKWEQERGGWIGGEERQKRVKRVEEFGGNGGWRRFGCYVLVEKFVLKRMDGSVVMTYSFNHTHQVKSKWE